MISANKKAIWITDHLAVNLANLWVLRCSFDLYIWRIFEGSISIWWWLPRCHASHNL